ncbi:PREDICTED: uncharacterized protein LOC106315453 isoform X3 [Brassica oleracea var. oleracea]|uniref:uncharacterized protein LOC106315453 isoform X3 n=1 Tax=Brassica oleracea var. oleracea TaxID=109376 RepID=UPI0006A73F48|nr:PREDICTED: uncharacterized protein LOC106315453 isoform X3 [Brassica oleracea var. oleracea]
MASNTLPAKDLTEVNVSIDDVSTAGPLCSLCFCDSVIYNIIMHAVIIGTLMCVKNWPEALLYGSLSHVFGVTAIFLLLRLISPVLAMRTCIPILSWVGITFIYQAISCCCKAVELDMKAERDAANLV